MQGSVEMTDGERSSTASSGPEWQINHREMARYLEWRGVPIESFGTAPARTVEHLFVELTRKDSSCELVYSRSNGLRLKCRRLRIDFVHGRTHFMQSTEKFDDYYHESGCREVDDYFSCMVPNHLEPEDKVGMLGMIRQHLRFPDQASSFADYTFIEQTKAAAAEYSDMYPSLTIEVDEVHNLSFHSFDRLLNLHYFVLQFLVRVEVEFPRPVRRFTLGVSLGEPANGNWSRELRKYNHVIAEFEPWSREKLDAIEEQNAQLQKRAEQLEGQRRELTLISEAAKGLCRREREQEMLTSLVLGEQHQPLRVGKLQSMLQKAGVDFSSWGTGGNDASSSSKPVESLVEEINSHKCTLVVVEGDGQNAQTDDEDDVAGAGGGDSVHPTQHRSNNLRLNRYVTVLEVQVQQDSVSHVGSGGRTLVKLYHEIDATSDSMPTSITMRRRGLRLPIKKPDHRPSVSSGQGSQLYSRSSSARTSAGNAGHSNGSSCSPATSSIGKAADASIINHSGVDTNAVIAANEVELVRAEALRAITRQLDVDINDVTLLSDSHQVSSQNEPNGSNSFPGLPTCYTTHSLVAVVRGLPITSYFQTYDPLQSGDLHPPRWHHWFWEENLLHTGENTIRGVRAPMASTGRSLGLRKQPSQLQLLFSGGRLNFTGAHDGASEKAMARRSLLTTAPLSPMAPVRKHYAARSFVTEANGQPQRHSTGLQFVNLSAFVEWLTARHGVRSIPSRPRNKRTANAPSLSSGVTPELHRLWRSISEGKTTIRFEPAHGQVVRSAMVVQVRVVADSEEGDVQWVLARERGRAQDRRRSTKADRGDTSRGHQWRATKDKVAAVKKVGGEGRVDREALTHNPATSTVESERVELEDAEELDDEDDDDDDEDEDEDSIQLPMRTVLVGQTPFEAYLALAHSRTILPSIRPSIISDRNLAVRYELEPLEFQPSVASVSEDRQLSGVLVEEELATIDLRLVNTPESNSADAGAQPRTRGFGSASELPSAGNGYTWRREQKSRSKQGQTSKEEYQRHRAAAMLLAEATNTAGSGASVRSIQQMQALGTSWKHYDKEVVAVASAVSATNGDGGHGNDGPTADRGKYAAWCSDEGFPEYGNLFGFNHRRGLRLKKTRHSRDQFYSKRKELSPPARRMDIDRGWCWDCFSNKELELQLKEWLEECGMDMDEPSLFEKSEGTSRVEPLTNLVKQLKSGDAWLQYEDVNNTTAASTARGSAGGSSRGNHALMNQGPNEAGRRRRQNRSAGVRKRVVRNRHSVEVSILARVSADTDADEAVGATSSGSLQDLVLLEAMTFAELARGSDRTIPVQPTEVEDEEIKVDDEDDDRVGVGTGNMYLKFSRIHNTVKDNCSVWSVVRDTIEHKLRPHITMDQLELVQMAPPVPVIKDSSRYPGMLMRYYTHHVYLRLKPINPSPSASLAFAPTESPAAVLKHSELPSGVAIAYKLQPKQPDDTYVDGVEEMPVKFIRQVDVNWTAAKIGAHKLHGEEEAKQKRRSNLRVSKDSLYVWCTLDELERLRSIRQKLHYFLNPRTSKIMWDFVYGGDNDLLVPSSSSFSEEVIAKLRANAGERRFRALQQSVLELAVEMDAKHAIEFMNRHAQFRHLDHLRRASTPGAGEDGRSSPAPLDRSGSVMLGEYNVCRYKDPFFMARRAACYQSSSVFGFLTTLILESRAHSATDSHHGSSEGMAKRLVELLGYAVNVNHVQCIQKLLAQNVEVRWEWLERAVRHNNLIGLQLLLESMGRSHWGGRGGHERSPMHKSSKMTSPHLYSQEARLLRIAAKHGTTDALSILLQHCRDPSEEYYATHLQGWVRSVIEEKSLTEEENLFKQFVLNSMYPLHALLVFVGKVQGNRREFNSSNLQQVAEFMVSCAVFVLDECEDFDDAEEMLDTEARGGLAFYNGTHQAISEASVAEAKDCIDLAHEHKVMPVCAHRYYQLCARKKYGEPMPSVGAGSTTANYAASTEGGSGGGTRGHGASGGRLVDALQSGLVMMAAGFLAGLVLALLLELPNDVHWQDAAGFGAFVGFGVGAGVSGTAYQLNVGANYLSLHARLALLPLHVCWYFMREIIYSPPTATKTRPSMQNSCVSLRRWVQEWSSTVSSGYFKFWSRQYLYFVFVVLIILSANTRAAMDGSSRSADSSSDADPMLILLGVLEPWLLLLVVAIRALIPAVPGSVFSSLASELNNGRSSADLRLDTWLAQPAVIGMYLNIAGITVDGLERVVFSSGRRAEALSKLTPSTSDRAWIIDLYMMLLFWVGFLMELYDGPGGDILYNETQFDGDLDPHDGPTHLLGFTAGHVLGLASMIAVFRAVSSMALMSESLGPLIVAIENMTSDVVLFAILLGAALISFGVCFVFAFAGSSGGQFHEDDALYDTVGPTYFFSLWRSLNTLAWAMFDPSLLLADPTAVGGDSASEVEYGHDVASTFYYLLGFLFIVSSFLILSNLLIAMMGHTYNAVHVHASDVYLYTRVRTLHYHAALPIVPPPLNLVTWVLYALLRIAELPVILTRLLFIHLSRAACHSCCSCRRSNSNGGNTDGETKEAEAENKEDEEDEEDKGCRSLAADVLAGVVLGSSVGVLPGIAVSVANGSHAGVKSQWVRHEVWVWALLIGALLGGIMGAVSSLSKLSSLREAISSAPTAASSYIAPSSRSSRTVFANSMIQKKIQRSIQRFFAEYSVSNPIDKAVGVKQSDQQTFIVARQMQRLSADVAAASAMNEERLDRLEKLLQQAVQPRGSARESGA
jgi:hypothetical protein